jgi:hypothetical protein
MSIYVLALLLPDSPVRLSRPFSFALFFVSGPPLPGSPCGHGRIFRESSQASWTLRRHLKLAGRGWVELVVDGVLKRLVARKGTVASLRKLDHHAKPLSQLAGWPTLLFPSLLEQPRRRLNCRLGR